MKLSLRYLSISQLSEVTGKDRRTVSKRLAGVKPHSTPGRAIVYDAAEAIQTIFVSDSVEGMDKKMMRVELAVSEERLAKLKLENGKTSGELATIEDVAKAVEKQYSFVRAQMRSMPSRLAKPLSMVTDPNEVYARLTEAIDECLSELTLDQVYEQQRAELEFAREATEPSAFVGPKAVAETEPSSVGGQGEIPVTGSELHTGPLED